MYKHNRPKQCSECVGSLRSAMLEKLRPAPLLGTEAKVSLTACPCGERPCLCGLTLTPPARGTQPAALSRAAVQTSPLSPHASQILIIYAPPPVPQSSAPRPSPPHTRSLGAHAYTTLGTKLDFLLQLNMGNGASSDPPSPKSAPCLPCPEQQRSQEDSAPETHQRQTRHHVGSAP